METLQAIKMRKYLELEALVLVILVDSSSSALEPLLKY